MAKAGEYEGYLPGSKYNLPRGDGEVVEASTGFLTIAYGGAKSPPVNPEAFELAVPTSPVRTRKEIVAGVFGRVRVLPLDGGRVALRFTSSDSAQLADMDVSELSSAIDTLTIIRDAMAEPTP